MRYKFRFWSDREKEIVMLDWGCIMQTAFNTQSIHDQHRATKIFQPLLYKVMSPAAPGVLMLWTGLRDKEGRDIYESDIVTLMDQSVERMAVVRWGQGTAGFFLLGRGHWQGNLSGGGEAYDSETCKIIGNIHENPDLAAKLEL